MSLHSALSLVLMLAGHAAAQEPVIPVADRTGAASSSIRGDGLRVRMNQGIARSMRLGPVGARDMPIAGRAASDGNASEGLLGLAVLARTTTLLHSPKGELWLFPLEADVEVALRPAEAAAAR